MDRAAEILAHRLALIELEGRDARSARVHDVHAWPVSIGRALDNHVVIDDPFVAPHHALLAPDAQGQLTLEVLDSRNGVVHEGKRLHSGRPLALPAGGATLQIGATRLRLRLPGEVLEAEEPLPALVRGHLSLPLLAGLGFVLLQLVTHWLALDPGADYSAWLPTLIGLPLALAGWAGIWALMSKLFQHHFEFGGHLRIALPWLLALGLAEALWPQLAAALGSPLLWRSSAPLQALLLALLVRAHLSLVLPQHQRAVTASVAVLTLAAAAISTALTYRASDSFSSAPYMSTLPLPALRLAGTVPTSTLVREMAPLADKLAKRVKRSRDDDEDDGNAEE